MTRIIDIPEFHKRREAEARRIAKVFVAELLQHDREFNKDNPYAGPGYPFGTIWSCMESADREITRRYELGRPPEQLVAWNSLA
jgi:hypothetical protein